MTKVELEYYEIMIRTQKRIADSLEQIAQSLNNNQNQNHGK